MAQVIFALAAGIIPAIFWLWFWLHEDEARPEPKPLIIEIFLLGALAVVPAYFLEKLLAPGNPVLLSGTNLWQLILIWALIEESLKYLAAVVGALETRFYDEPVDAMIYMVTSALGFAAVENTLFILSDLASRSQSFEYLMTGNFRFLGATLVHVVASALIGCFIGLSFKQKRLFKIFYFLIGLVLAVILHALFNYFIIKSAADQIFKIFGLLWLTGLVIIFLFERVKSIIIEQTTI